MVGQHRARDAEDAQQLVVPVEGLQVHQHGAAGVGDVGGVDAAVGAAGEVPQHPGVGVAEEGVARFGGLADAVDVLQDPLDLAAGEVGGRRQARLAADGLAVAVAFEGGGDGVGAGVLPDDGVVVRAAVARVPDDGGLALVGDADRGQVGGRRARRCAGRSGSPSWCAPRSPPGRARPSPRAGRIWWCSSWCFATSLPSWSKIMKRVLVVPWSTAPTNSGMAPLLQLSGPSGAGVRPDSSRSGRREEPADQELVEGGAERPPTSGPTMGTQK